ncbi:MAG: Smr/MutS family protein [Bacteroidota bacterium]
MRCAHPHTNEKLGFDAVLKVLSGYLYSEEARQLLTDLKPTSKVEALLPELKRVAEFVEMTQLDDPFPLRSYVGIGGVLDKLTVKGNWLTREELWRVLGWMKNIAEARSYFKSREEAYPHLHKWVMQGSFSPKLMTHLESILDERGNIRDNASPALAGIRKASTTAAGKLRNTLYRILRKANQNNWSLEKEITIRNDRLVIPVKADFKGRVPGFVQDISQSGGTVYVEPTEVLPLNNEVKELKIREHNEIIRILQQASALLSEEVESLSRFKAVMARLEWIQAKARLAQDLDAVLPKVQQENQEMHLLEAYYPPLLLKAKEEQIEVIPLQVHLTRNRRILIISGPNAGGKSVALKTIGLLQLMLQSGMLVPVSEESSMAIFSSLFLDIGDEQSVDNDLSTYTSRLFQYRKMGDQMNSQSLFLVDEFGSGTDPKQGGAIAEAFLERFVRQGATGVITTHYGNLKDFAEITKGVANAAMQFDQRGLKPTYALIEGMPGRSYAFEMAKRVGVHHSIIRQAESKVGQDELNTEKLIKELERKNLKLSRKVNENAKQEAKLERLVDEYEKKSEALKRDKKEIIRKAKAEAKGLIEGANKRIENTIREIKETNAEKKATQEARRKLAASAPEVPEAQEEISEGLEQTSGKKRNRKAGASRPKKPSIEILADQKPVEGDWVKLKQSSTTGILTDIQGKKGVVESGGLRINVKLDQLVKIKSPKPEKEASAIRVIGGISPVQARSQLDLMGKRVEEALVEVDRLVDEARLSGLTHLRILHGKGNGTLRQAIRHHLQKHHAPASLEDAPVELGGAGWTIVELGE